MTKCVAVKSKVITGAYQQMFASQTYQSPMAIRSVCVHVLFPIGAVHGEVRVKCVRGTYKNWPPKQFTFRDVNHTVT